MNKQTLTALGAAVLTSVAAPVAWGQGRAAKAPDPSPQALRAQKVQLGVGSQVLTVPSLSSLRQSGVSLVTAQGTSEVSASLGLELQQAIPESSLSCRSFFSADCIGAMATTFTASAVTGARRDRVALPLGNPNADASLKFQFRYSKSGWTRDDGWQQLGAELCTALKQALENKLLVHQGEELPDVEKSRTCSLENLRRHVRAPDLEPAIKKYIGQATGSAMHLGIEANAGQRTFTQGDLADLDKTTDRVLRPQSVSLLIGYQPARGGPSFGGSDTSASSEPGRTLFLIKGTWGRDYKDPDAGIGCLTSADVPPITRCVQGSFGAPTKVNTNRWSVEIRHQLDNGFGLGLIATQDRVSKTRRLDIPLYLSSDEDGKLTGGLMLTRTSGSSRLQPSLFIGVPFSVSL